MLDPSEDYGMQDYQQILVAADLYEGAEVSERALLRAQKIAACSDARLTVLTIIEHFPEDLPTDAIPPEDIDPASWLLQQAEQGLAALTERLGLSDAQRLVETSTGSAKAAVVDYAKRHACDLIVVGTHGTAGIRGLMGSTAMGIVHAATCDVTVVR